MKAPNLYQYFAVDPSENSTALGVQLAGRDARLAQQGVDESAQTRHEVMIGYSVLGDDARRKLYDAALATGRPVTWAELDHLAAFSDWPPNYAGWNGAQQQAPGWGQQAQQAGFAAQPNQMQPNQVPGPAQHYPHSAYADNRPVSERSPYGNPLDPLQDPRANAQFPVFGYPTGVVNYAEQAQRPSASTRAWMALLDGFFALILASMISSPFALLPEDAASAISVFVFGLVLTAYAVIPEVKWGGTPVKLMAGYEVRNAQTHQRLTYAESLRRNWFRAANILPGLGQMIGLLGAAVAIGTVTPENGLRGGHDRLAGAEVVKR